MLYDEAAAEHTRLRADADARLARIEALECRLWQDGVGEVLESTARLVDADVTELTFIEPLIKRVRGMALAMSGSVDEARASLLESVGESRSRRSDFETARTLDVLCAISSPDDIDRADWTEERDEIFRAAGCGESPGVAAGAPGVHFVRGSPGSNFAVILAVPAESSERAETHGAPMVTGRGLPRHGGNRPTYSPLTGSSVAGAVNGIPLPPQDDDRLRNGTGDPKQTCSDHLFAWGTVSRIALAFGVVMVTVFAAPLVASIV